MRLANASSSRYRCLAAALALAATAITYAARIRNHSATSRKPNPESRVPSPDSGSAAQPRLVEAYGRLPMSFEINKGQTDTRVKFLSRGSGYSLFLTGNEAVLALRKGGRQSKGRRIVAQGSPFNPAAFPAMGSAELAFRSAAFPGLLRSLGTETNSKAADPKTGSALQGLMPASQREVLRAPWQWTPAAGSPMWQISIPSTFGHTRSAPLAGRSRSSPGRPFQQGSLQVRLRWPT